MKSKLKKLVIFLFTIVILLVVIGFKYYSNEKEEKIKTDNYDQEKVKIQEGRIIQSMMILDDKSIVIAALNSQGDICVLKSNYKGNIWNRKKIDLPKEEGKLNSVLQTSILKDGNILISYSSSDINLESFIVESVDVKYIIVDKNGNRKY